MKKVFILVISVVVLSLLVLAGCTATATAKSTPSPTPVPTVTSPVPTTNSISSISGLEGTLEGIYAQVNPAVVNITVMEKPAAGSSPLFGQQPSSQALGSGFLWDNQGDIVTNNHVIANADNITVIFYDGTTVPGKVIGADADSDLAVVKVDMPNLNIQPVQLADSSTLKVGQLAIAIGNPFGLSGTMTVGFVSGLGRVLPANENAVGPSYSIPDIIQTDAAINPGNSGGVLLDDTGKVIGVTSSIATTTGSSAGVGFAIPSSIVQKVVPSLITSGHYAHPYIGATILSLDPDVATAMNLPANQRGALIEALAAGGPAAKAGLKASNTTVTISGQDIQVGGDVIIAYNGQAVKSSDDLITMMALTGSVGQTVTMTILRNGQQMQVQVTLGARPTS
jgi:2-alkenal reductase